MKSNKLFLFSVVFIITFLSVSNSNVSALPLPPLDTNITIKMFRLQDSGGTTTIPCEFNPPDTSFGCAFYNFSYPYTSNPINIDVENDYLLDVIAQEMNPGSYPQPAALKAQAIASRSFAQYYINNPLDPPHEFNNSNDFQVFIPYRFENLTPFTIPNNSTQPCASTNLNENQLAVCNAVAARLYIAQAANNTDNNAAKALFMGDQSIETLDATFDKPYLKSVTEPISTTCDANNFGHGYGMSQEGAVRWARGNQCAKITAGNIPWSVRWNNENQILFHYYTGVHLRDIDLNRLSPNDRWNPLEITAEGDCPLIMDSGQTCTLTFTVQNTGTTTWNGQYAFITHGWEATIGNQPVQIIDQADVIIQPVLPGQNFVFHSTFTAPFADVPGLRYNLRFEMGIYDEYAGYIGFSELDPERPWQPYIINVCVGGPCKTYLSITLN